MLEICDNVKKKKITRNQIRLLTKHQEQTIIYRAITKNSSDFPCSSAMH